MPQLSVHPYFLAIAPRELSEVERATVERLLVKAPEFAGELSRLKVVGRCGCGACPTVFFREASSRDEWDVAHSVGQERNGGITGVVLMASSEGLSQLEFYSLDGHDPWGLPEVSSLEPTAA